MSTTPFGVGSQSSALPHPSTHLHVWNHFLCPISVAFPPLADALLSFMTFLFLLFIYLLLPCQQLYFQVKRLFRELQAGALRKWYSFMNLCQEKATRFLGSRITPWHFRGVGNLTATAGFERTVASINLNEQRQCSWRSSMITTLWGHTTDAAMIESLKASSDGNTLPSWQLIWASAPLVPWSLHRKMWNTVHLPALLCIQFLIPQKTLQGMYL